MGLQDEIARIRQQKGLTGTPPAATGQDPLVPSDQVAPPAPSGNLLQDDIARVRARQMEDRLARESAGYPATDSPLLQQPMPRTVEELQEGMTPRGKGEALSGQDWWSLAKSGGKEAARSTIEGLAAGPDLIYALGGNLSNLISGAITGERYPIPAPVTELVNRNFPPDPEHPWVRDIFNVAGPMALEAGLSAPAIVRSGVSIPRAIGRATERAALGTGEAYAGGDVGGAVGEAIGGPTGEELGQIIGGAGAQTIAPARLPRPRELVDLARERKYVTPGRSADLYHVYEGAGVDPTLAEIGNPQAAVSAQASQYIPLAGRAVEEIRNRQQTQLANTKRLLADRRRGGAGPPLPRTGDSDITTLGRQVSDVAEAADQNIDTALDRNYQPFRDAVPGNAVDPNPNQLRAEMGQEIRRVPAAGTIRQDLRDLLGEAELNAHDPLQPPKIADPTREQILQTQLANAQADLVAARVARDDVAAASAQQRIDDRNRDIYNNRGQTRDDALYAKANLRERLKPNRPGPQQDRAALNAAQASNRGALERMAADAGMDVDEYRRINQRERELHDQSRLIRPLYERPSGTTVPVSEPTAHSALFSKSKESSTPILNVLTEHGPPAMLDDLAARQLDYELRGPNANPAAGEAQPPRGGRVDSWNNKSPEMREFLAGPDPSLRQTLVQALGVEDNMVNQARIGSRGGNPVISTAYRLRPLINALLGGVGGGAVGGLLGGPAGALLGSALTGMAGASLPTILARRLQHVLSDPEIARRAVFRQRMNLADRSLPHLLAGAVAGSHVNQSEAQGAR